MRTNFCFVLVLVVVLFFNSFAALAQCSGSGVINTTGNFGNPASLDPDGDGDIVAAGTNFTGCTQEIDEFEQVINPSGCPTCQVPWTPIGVNETHDDLWSGNGCGQTDIVSDSDGGNDFGYFSVVDPDGACNSGDEFIAFRVRVSQAFSGNFGFSFFVSNDGLTGENDPDGMSCSGCNKIANSGFEYEVQFASGNNGSVVIYDINGVVGSSNCVVGGAPGCTTYPKTTHTQEATACGNAAVCKCRNDGGTPIFLTVIVLISDIGIDCSGISNLTIVPATGQSGSPIIANCTSVADAGGIGSLTSLATDCPECASPSYPGCSSTADIACGLNCVAENNSFSSALPIELAYFKAEQHGVTNEIKWASHSELNTEYHVVEKSENPNLEWFVLEKQIGQGTSQMYTSYQSIDPDPFPLTYYRLITIDYDGTKNISSTISVRQEINTKNVRIYPNPVSKELMIDLITPASISLSISIKNVLGQQFLLQKNITENGRLKHKVDMSKYNKGIYFLTIDDGFKQKVIKVVKTD